MRPDFLGAKFLLALAALFAGNMAASGEPLRLKLRDQASSAGEDRREWSLPLPAGIDLNH